MPSEFKPEYEDQAFALCDMGFRELGNVSIEEMMLTQSENDIVELVIRNRVKQQCNI